LRTTQKTVVTAITITITITNNTNGQKSWGV
jgi:hypothetical protein